MTATVVMHPVHKERDDILTNVINDWNKGELKSLLIISVNHTGDSKTSWVNLSTIEAAGLLAMTQVNLINAN